MFYRGEVIGLDGSNMTVKPDGGHVVNLDFAIAVLCKLNEIRYGSEGMKQAETTFLDRLKTEEAELAEKTEKLYAFFGTGTYKGMSKREQELLGGQYEAMTEYLAILGERIAFYTEAES